MLLNVRKWKACSFIEKNIRIILNHLKEEGENIKN